MKINTVAVTALLIGATSFLSANSVYSPSEGVICDKKAEFCSDSYGISVEMTKRYLGRRAANKTARRLDSPDFDSTSFTLSNGLSCNAKRKECKKSKWDDNADPHWTKVLFGRTLRPSAPAKHTGIYSPEQGIVCDTKAGFCSDSQGIAMALTKEYLGQAAQDKLMGYGDDFITTSFGMSNGVYCDTDDKRCYNNKLKDSVNKRYTKMLFI